MQSKGMVFNLPNVLDISLPLCEDCVYGKQHKSNSFAKGSSRTSSLLDLMHSDVCGPM
jgi:hypothetical protein